VTDHIAAWDALNAAPAGLPGWRASRPQRHALTGEWTAVVFDGRKLGRGKVHEALEARGVSEAEAIAALAELAARKVASEVAT
jgi:hypothetical protein